MTAEDFFKDQYQPEDDSDIWFKRYFRSDMIKFAEIYAEYILQFQPMNQWKEEQK